MIGKIALNKFQHVLETTVNNLCYTGHSIQLGCTAADPRNRSDLDFLVFLDQSEHWSPPLVGEPKLLLEGRQGTWFNYLMSYLDLAL